MKNFFCLLPVLALVFSACSDDDDLRGYTLRLGAGDIKNAPSDDEIDNIRLVTVDGGVLQTTLWDEGFKLVFPDRIPSDCLSDIADTFGLTAGQAARVITGNGEARLCESYIEGYKGSMYVKDFYMTNEAENRVVTYYYCDRAVKVTGTVTESAGGRENSLEFNLDMSKGWNRVLESWSETTDKRYREFTTTIPASGLSWVYDTLYQPL